MARGVVQEMGTRVVSFKLKADKARLIDGTVDTSAPLCWPDNTELKKIPFYFKLEHNTIALSLRNIKFHSEEVITTVSEKKTIEY